HLQGWVRGWRRRLAWTYNAGGHRGRDVHESAAQDGHRDVSTGYTLRGGLLMRELRTLSALGFVMVALACQDDPQRLTTAPLRSPGTDSVLYLTVSDEIPPVGTKVTVTAHARRFAGVHAIGSF